MAVVALTWNGTTLPYPAVDGINVDRSDFAGRAVRMVDGSLRVDYVAEKHSIAISWVDLSPAEYTTLINAYAANKTTASALRLPNSDSYTVLPKHGSLADNQYYDSAGDALHSVQISFMEV